LVPAVDGKTGIFIFRLDLNHLPGRRVSSPARAMFHPSGGDETKLRRDETIFAAGEDIRKPALSIN
jgi:hypothetical protein